MKLTLDESWEYCLKMWKWISRKCLDEDHDVVGLKEQWLNENGFGDEYIEGDCFFCDNDHNNKDDCDFCPARLVDSTFCCTNNYYHWRERPREFYKKLKELNRKRR